MRAILTTIKPLDPLGLVSIFYAINDGMMAAESSDVLDLSFENHSTTYACMRVLTLSKGYYTPVSMIAMKLDIVSVQKLFGRA